MIFLHGGGDHPEARQDTFGRFVQAATAGTTCRLALVVAEPTESQARESFMDYQAIFSSLPEPPTGIEPVLVSAGRPLARADLEQIAPTGLFVCGGATPLYHQALCMDPSWVGYLNATGIPYCGTSAGAAVAARQAILGGWQSGGGGQTRSILFQGASEGLDLLTVREGLGLAPFAIDVHASQMGTLARLIHAVDLGLVPEGWAIDENTMLVLEYAANMAVEIHIHGRGHGYHVWRGSDQGLQVEIKTAA